MDLNHLIPELRLCWLLDEPYDKVKAFWDALANTPNRTSTRTERNRSGIIRVCHPSYKRMKKVGWMNLDKLEDNENNNIQPDASPILEMVRAHATSNGGSSRQASPLMLLNPYVYKEGYDYLRLKLQAVPSCVPYVLLKKSNVIFNRIAFSTNYFSHAHINRLTSESLRWINYRYMRPSNIGNGYRPAPRTRLGNIDPWAENLNAHDYQQILLPEAECVICIEPIVAAEESYVILECLHPFHAHCIRKWKREKKFQSRCPSCRADIIPLVHRNMV